MNDGTTFGRIAWRSSYDVSRFFEDRPDSLLNYVRWAMRYGYSIPGCCLNTVIALSGEPLSSVLGPIERLPRGDFYGTTHFRNLEGLLIKIELKYCAHSAMSHYHGGTSWNTSFH